jgi:hypothetical protein
VQFIGNWILTDGSEKRKVFYDVWNIVLKNYMPTTRRILFRACGRINNSGRIASFTGRLECARRFSKGNGSLIICDTNRTMEMICSWSFLKFGTGANSEDKPVGLFEQNSK